MPENCLVTELNTTDAIAYIQREIKYYTMCSNTDNGKGGGDFVSDSNQ